MIKGAVGEMEKHRYGENILRKTSRGDGMKENCLYSRSFETTRIREGQETEGTNQNIWPHDSFYWTKGWRSSFFAQKLWNIQSLPTKQFKTMAIFFCIDEFYYYY